MTRPYSVLLLRPDFMSESFGQDTYLAWVRADSVEVAQELAQREAYSADVPPDDEDHNVEHAVDYFVLMVVDGHVHDLKVVD